MWLTTCILRQYLSTDFITDIVKNRLNKSLFLIQVNATFSPPLYIKDQGLVPITFPVHLPIPVSNIP